MKLLSQNGVVDYVRASQSGYWKGLQIATANAHVKKHSQKSQIVVTVPSIRKKITFDVDVNTKKEAVGEYLSLPLSCFCDVFRGCLGD